jgi:hypothetical protein
MASTIQIKRGTGSAVPSGLADGELAINLDSGKFYYGSGSESRSNFTVESLTAESYVVSSSVVHMTQSFSSGSTQFGNDASDTHYFSGSITSSHDVSSSLAGTVSAGSGSYHVLKGDESKATGLYIDGTITSSGDISSSGTITAATLDAAAVTDGLAAVIVAEIDNDEIPIAKLAEDAVTITAGDGLKTGGSVTLGSSVTLDIDVSDFAGTGLSGDGSENLNIDAAQTGITSVTNTSLKVGRGTTDTYIDFGTDDKIQLKPANSTALEVETTGIDVTGDITASANISGGISTIITAASASFNVIKSNDTSANGLEVNGTVTANTGSFDVVTKSMQIIPWYYYLNSTLTTEKHIPFNSSTDASNGQYYNQLIAPYDGMVKRLTVAFHDGNPGNITVRTKKATSPQHVGTGYTVIETETIGSAVDDTTYTFNFSSSFDAEDSVFIGIQQDGNTSSVTYVVGMVAIEFDTSS